MRPNQLLVEGNPISFTQSFYSPFASFFQGEQAPIIVGIDAGTTSAFAIIDYAGKIIAVKSKKNWGTDQLASEISAVCTPLVIACDTNPSSGAARRLRACFGAKLFVPQSSLHVYQKHLMAEKLGVEVHNSHERDAVAAAKKAFNHYSNKLRQTTAFCRRYSLDAAMACRQVMQGTRIADL